MPAPGIEPGIYSLQENCASHCATQAISLKTPCTALAFHSCNVKTRKDFGRLVPLAVLGKSQVTSFSGPGLHPLHQQVLPNFSEVVVVHCVVLLAHQLGYGVHGHRDARVVPHFSQKIQANPQGGHHEGRAAGLVKRDTTRHACSLPSACSTAPAPTLGR